MNCLNCGNPIKSKRSDAKFCKPSCRVTFNRLSVTRGMNVTDNSTKRVTDNFSFTVRYNRKLGDAGYDSGVEAERRRVRTPVYWYDVPLAAIPVRRKGWPEMPEYMNGRQYFLWWKNEFKVNDKGEPIIFNPFPATGDVKYEMGGEGSRKWGA